MTWIKEKLETGTKQVFDGSLLMLQILKMFAKLKKIEKKNKNSQIGRNNNNWFLFGDLSSK